MPSLPVETMQDQLRAAEKIKSTILLVFLPVFRVTSLVTYNQYETSDAP
jgi:hypothetical protein